MCCGRRAARCVIGGCHAGGRRRSAHTVVGVDRPAQHAGATPRSVAMWPRAAPSQAPHRTTRSWCARLARRRHPRWHRRRPRPPPPPPPHCRAGAPANASAGRPPGDRRTCASAPHRTSLARLLLLDRTCSADLRHRPTRTYHHHRNNRWYRLGYSMALTLRPHTPNPHVAVILLIGYAISRTASHPHPFTSHYTSTGGTS